MADDKAPGPSTSARRTPPWARPWPPSTPRSGATAWSVPLSTRRPGNRREDAEAAHRDVRDQVSALLAARKADVVDAEGGYALPFPVLSAVDAAALGAVLEDGVAAAWVRVLDQAAEHSTREFAVGVLSAAEVASVGWRSPPARRRSPARSPACRTESAERAEERVGDGDRVLLD